jgi:methylglutaconyl-CoA hydratase
MLETVDSCPAPVVCCVHGFALGGGSGLVACADIAVAWPDATFGFTEVRLGIIPAVISPFVLAKIGSAARRYFVTGERFGPEVALSIGLVSEVSEDAGERAEQIVHDVLAGGPIAVREAKKLVRERPTGVDTAHIAAARRTSEEGQDGLRAFLDRRAPGWLDEP